MFDHTAFDVAIGLTLLYVVLSVAASAISEWISTAVGLRARTLRAGVENLFGADYSRKLYRHPMIRNLANNKPLEKKAPKNAATDEAKGGNEVNAGTPGEGKRKPSYLDSNTVAAALIDLVAHDDKGKPVVDLEGKAAMMIDRVEDPHLKQVLRALNIRGAGTVDELRRELASWFDEGMSRVSGWYKRRAHLFVLVIATVVTVLTNASTIHVARDLWEDDALRTALAEEAVNLANASDSTRTHYETELLESFPVGWENGIIEDLKTGGLQELPGRLFGWLLTIAAVSLGAPFWFDVLGKVSNLRGAGARKSDDKSN